MLLLMVIAVAEVSVMVLLGSPKPNSNRVMQRGLSNTWTCSDLLTEGNPEFRKVDFYNHLPIFHKEDSVYSNSIGKPVFCSGVKH